MVDGTFGLEGYRYSQMITIYDLTGPAFSLIEEYAMKCVEESNINAITLLETELRKFCEKHGLKNPEIAINQGNIDELFEKSSDIFRPELFGQQAVIDKKNAEFMNEMGSFVKEKMSNVDLKDENAVIYFKDTSEFNGYFGNMAFEKYPEVKGHSIMVIKDMSKKKLDLIFTTDGIVNVVKDKVKNITPYKEVKLKSESIVLYNKEYKSTTIDVNVLYNVICNLGTRFIKSVEDKIEFIDGTVTLQILNEWFKERKDIMTSSVYCVYSIMEKSVLELLGYHFYDENELDNEHHLLQYCYDTTSGSILDMRIVRFENIESNFQGVLLENRCIKDKIYTEEK